MKYKRIIIILLIGLSACSPKNPGSNSELEDSKSTILPEWFSSGKFGMFIHWGPYSLMGGEWNGKHIEQGDIAEWIMERFKIPVEEYRKVAATFNPVQFNAKEWVALAKSAGMKYIIITAKHHDGFAMFDSKVSGYNIVDYTPFKRDPLKELSVACAEAGLKFCVYYSHREDWEQPYAYGNTWDYDSSQTNLDKMDHPELFRKYLDDKAIPQLKELLTNYGPLGIVWFDRGMYTQEQGKEFADLVHRLQPGCLVNGRVGHYDQELQGDYQSLTDNGMPVGGIEEAWETPQTLNDTWGFSKLDQNWKPARDIIKRMVAIVSKGGNYLLNVGPTGEGVIPGPSVAILASVGDWMNKNSECIYETSPSPFPVEFPWGFCTRKDDLLYLHVFNWPADGKLKLEGLNNEIRKAYLLTEKDVKLKIDRDRSGQLLISLPETRPDPINSVVVLQIAGSPDIDPLVIIQKGGEPVVLDFLTAATHGKAVKRFNRRGEEGQFHISKMEGPDDIIEWHVNMANPGMYDVFITYAAIPGWENCSYQVSAGKEKISGVVKSSPGWYEYKTEKIGQIKVSKTGETVFRLFPERKLDHYLMYFRSLQLVHAKDAGGSKVEEIIVVCKTHFDIGYTHRVDEIVDYYRTEMIDKALSNLDQSKDMPREQQFTWTGPGWVMAKVTEDWEGQTPERRQRLDQVFRSGRFVTHAMPFTYETDVVSPELLARSYEPSSMVSRKYGLPLSRDAKMTDVPSHSRLLATALSRGGVKFIHMGCNWPSGSVQYPDLFWWEGPDGSRVLAMYSSIYGTCTAFWPRAFGKGEGREQPGSIGVNLLPPEGWPHKVWLAIIVTGDNTGPPLAKDLEPMFAEVREKYPNIKIRMGRMEDFAQAIIDSKPDLPVIRAEAPDTWIHGVMCDPGGQKLARNLQPLIPAAEALNTQMRYWGLPVADASAGIVNAFEKCMLYDEHTWGGYASVEEFGEAFKNIPSNKYSDLEASWEDKTTYIQTAGRMTNEILSTNLNALAASVNQSGPRLVVYNPLPWSRSARIEIPGSPGHFMLANEIPAGGYKTFPINPAASSDPAVISGNSIENKYFKVAFDPLRGVISSLVDKRSGREWVDAGAEQGLGQYMNERFTLEQTLAYTYKYQQGRAMGSFGNPTDKDWPHPGMFKPGMISEKVVPYRAASPAGGVLKISRDAAGESATLTMPGNAATHLPATELRVRLDDDQGYVDMEIFIKDKAKDNWPEADWLCLPFKCSDPAFRVGRNLGFMNPEEIIPGANRHLYTTGSGITITGPDGSGIAVVPLDHPLVSLGEPGCWKFSLDYVPKKPVVYLNLYNNQWNTNFRYWYAGSWSSRIRILTFEKGTDENKALVTPSMEARMPLQAYMADGTGGDLPSEQEGIRTSHTGIAVTAFGADFDGSGGTLLRVWEQGGNAGQVTLSLPAGCKAGKAHPVNFRGEKEGRTLRIRNGQIKFYLGAFAPASFVLTN